MPKKAKELTALAVTRLKEEGRYAVGGVDGLHLRVTGNLVRSWILRIQVGDKRRDLGLGSYPGISLADARDAAREFRKQIQLGIDPRAQKRQLRSALKTQQSGDKTFKECAEIYIKAKSDEWKNAKHRQQWANTLETYAYPHIGSLRAADISLQSVLAVLEPIWRTKNETASRLRGRIESILDFATVRQYRTGDNPARWKGHLDTLLPSPSKIQKIEHHAAMPIDATSGFMGHLRRKQGMSIRALEFVVLTACRSGEVRGATWDEVDLETGIWTIPAVRMKSGIEHRVPLSNQAKQLLEELPVFADSSYVFPAQRGGQLSDMALTQVMRRMKLNYVPHGFRSTFRDWAGERTHYPRELAEQALAHSIGNKVEAAYRRGDALEKRRIMMQDWADYLDAINK